MGNNIGKPIKATNAAREVVLNQLLQRQDDESTIIKVVVDAQALAHNLQVEFNVDALMERISEIENVLQEEREKHVTTIAAMTDAATKLNNKIYQQKLEVQELTLNQTNSDKRIKELENRLESHEDECSSLGKDVKATKKELIVVKEALLQANNFLAILRGGDTGYRTAVYHLLDQVFHPELEIYFSPSTADSSALDVVEHLHHLSRDLRDRLERRGMGFKLERTRKAKKGTFKLIDYRHKGAHQKMMASQKETFAVFLELVRHLYALHIFSLKGLEAVESYIDAYEGKLKC